MKLIVTFDNDEEKKALYSSFSKSLGTEDPELIQTAINLSAERHGLRGLRAPFIRPVRAERADRANHPTVEDRKKQREERIKEFRDRQLKARELRGA